MGKIYSTAEISPRTKVEIADDAVIGSQTFISVPVLEIGEGSQINRGTSIIGNQPCIIGKHVVCSYNVLIMTSSDSIAPRMDDHSDNHYRKIIEGQVTLGDYSYVGAFVTINPGVILGEGAVVGAYAFVPRSRLIPGWTVGWGQPWRRRGVRPRHI